MDVKLSTSAIEESSYGVTITFYDSSGSVVTPATLYWTLETRSGTVINSRTAVEVTSITNPYTIVLSGNDLALQNSNSQVETRLLIVYGTADDATLGSGSAFRFGILFDIDSINRYQG